MTPRKTRQKRAFTLIELLAATMMMALVAASLYTSLNVAFRARDTALHAVDTIRGCDAAFSLIQEDLQAAVPPGGEGKLAGTFVGNSFGTALGTTTNTPGLASLTPAGPAAGASTFGTVGDTLTFFASVTDLEANAPVGDIKKIELGLAPQSGSTAVPLVRRLTANLLAPAPVTNEEVLCPDVRSFTLRYFDGQAWQINWDSNSTNNLLPAAVEVTLELGGLPASAGNRPGCRMTRVIPLPTAVTNGGTFVGTSLTTPTGNLP